MHETCDCRHGMVGPFHTANYEDRQFVLEEQGLQPALRSLGLRLFEGDAAASGSTVRVSYYLVYSSPTVEEVSCTCPCCLHCRWKVIIRFKEALGVWH